MSFTDKILTCRDCGTQFTWTAGEQEFYQSRGLQNQPSRCPACRQQRKASSGGGGSYSAGGGYDRAPRQMYPAVCDSCGKQTEVPFQPTSGKPVYCSDCFRDRRSSGGYGGARSGGYGSRY
jgi:CxxC-x17-CxxC domain-containing protein